MRDRGRTVTEIVYRRARVEKMTKGWKSKWTKRETYRGIHVQK